VIEELQLVGVLLLVIMTYGLGGSVLSAPAAKFLGNFAATVTVFIVFYLIQFTIPPLGLRAEVVPLPGVEIGEGIINLPANASG
jgi:uncharacterized membrane protein AbrB (regulator of aidB expression)